MARRKFKAVRKNKNWFPLVEAAQVTDSVTSYIPFKLTFTIVKFAFLHVLLFSDRDYVESTATKTTFSIQ